MKIYTTVEKTFDIVVPEEMFKEEYLQDIRDFCEAYRNLKAEDLTKAIASAYSLGGDGYYEQFGAYVGEYPWQAEEYQIFVQITNFDHYCEDVWEVE